MQKVLAPAIELCKDGFPVGAVSAFLWKKRASVLSNGPYGNELLFDGLPPKEGQIVKNPGLAKVFSLLATHGKDGFYKGFVADAIVDVVKEIGRAVQQECRDRSRMPSSA
eukprot:TRINITY_DN29751_c0_g1_i9.p1 TRINITY_DN29751_c0_g1~~TRINITY_DN29751_c0_g1_i9.p1  ORF type:complete len:110 (+),score=26.92 TRINITY_DN29751_c0_g1_i9:281-610(+)